MKDDWGPFVLRRGSSVLQLRVKMTTMCLAPALNLLEIEDMTGHDVISYHLPLMALRLVVVAEEQIT